MLFRNLKQLLGVLMLGTVSVVSQGESFQVSLNVPEPARVEEISGSVSTFIANYKGSSAVVSTKLKFSENKACATTPKVVSLSVQSSSIPCLCTHYSTGKPVSCGSPMTFAGSVSAVTTSVTSDTLNVHTKSNCPNGYSYSSSGKYNVIYKVECDEKSAQPAPVAAAVGPLVVPTNINVSKKNHFKTLWIEPLAHSNYTSYSEILDYLTNIKNLGVERIVIAYSFADWGHCFMYTPKAKYTFTAYNNTGANVFTTVKVDSLNPNLACKNTAKYSKFFDYFFQASELLNLKVMVGLSRTGDVFLINDVQNKISGNTGGMYMPYYDVNSRLSTAVSLSKSMAADIFAQFGKFKAFEGWYLAHETGCLDVGSNYYDPVARYLKSLANKKVMISPPVDADACYGGTLLDYVANHKGLIDVYSYQDTLGAGSLVVNGTAVNFYTALARDQRLYELANGRLYALSLIHAQTGTDFQINVEGWEMSGPSYGNAYGGDFSRIKKQLDVYSGYTKNLMLNEGFLLFQFGHPTLSFSESSQKGIRAKKFAEDYMNYLSK